MGVITTTAANRKTTSSLLLLALLHSLVFCNFRDSHPSDYSRALYVVNFEFPRWQEIAVQFNENTEILVAIVFPEIVRYQALRDFIECKALALAYVSIGTIAADFSVGLFQMKPSFAEFVDSLAVNDRSTEQMAHLFRYKEGLSPVSERRVRLERLRTPEWQMLYLIAFIKIIRTRIVLPEPSDSVALVKTLATAYNLGTNATTTTIASHMKRRIFPYGTLYPFRQYCYSEVASSFYVTEHNKHNQYPLTNVRKDFE